MKKPTTTQLLRQRNKYARLAHLSYLYFLGKLDFLESKQLGYDLARSCTSADLKKLGINLKSK